MVSDIPGSKGIQLGDGARERLRALLGRLGEAGAAKEIGVSSVTFARALAGLPLQRATAHFVTDKLNAIAEAAAQEGASAA